MQHHKDKFNNPEYKNTFCNIQPCIRTNDIEEFGDNSHLILFNMIGLFSFREMEIFEVIDFFFGYLQQINVYPSHVTIHPKMQEWKKYYKKYNIKVIEDDNCTWSDGNIGGYCTEFFVNDLEIGNIVNTNGDCIDVGFGLERLMMVKGININHNQNLIDTVQLLLDRGIKPSASKHGYVLKKLIRMIRDRNIKDLDDHPIIKEEHKKYQKSIERYLRLKDKHSDKSVEWWWETHGVDIKEHNIVN